MLQSVKNRTTFMLHEHRHRLVQRNRLAVSTCLGRDQQYPARSRQLKPERTARERSALLARSGCEYFARRRTDLLTECRNEGRHALVAAGQRHVGHAIATLQQRHRGEDPCTLAP